MKPNNAAPDALKALQAAKKLAQERAKELEDSFPEETTIDLSAEECYIQLVITMFACGLKVGLGVMPDGMAIWCRLSMPSTAKDPRAGMVSFLVHSDPTEVLRKAILALESSKQSSYWKEDRYAKQSGGGD